jgi:hypothetical protein
MGQAAGAAILGGVKAGETILTRQAGKPQEEELKLQATQEELAGKQREADRKANLAQVLASQSAQAGARGITFEGSPLTILQEDIAREEEATERDVFQTQLAARTLRTRGKVARKQANLAATLSLLKSAGQVITQSPGGTSGQAASGQTSQGGTSGGS